MNDHKLIIKNIDIWQLDAKWWICKGGNIELSQCVRTAFPELWSLLSDRRTADTVDAGNRVDNRPDDGRQQDNADPAERRAHLLLCHRCVNGGRHAEDDGKHGQDVRPVRSEAERQRAIRKKVDRSGQRWHVRPPRRRAETLLQGVICWQTLQKVEFLHRGPESYSSTILDKND